MKRRLSRWIGSARTIESAITARIAGAAQRLAASSGHQPIETIHAVLDAIEREVQPGGRGRPTFPFTHVRLWLAAATRTDRARLEAVCDGPPSLGERIADRLATAGCPGDAPALKVSFTAEPRADWSRPDFHVEYIRETAAAPEPARRQRLELTVAQGAAERTTYVLTGGTTTIGRGGEVRDDRQRLVRTNDVAFVEGAGEINQSVSRRHAHIDCDSSASTFRLHDDGGTGGTAVIRDGRTVDVPRGRGLRLRSGDVIVLGRARLRVKIQDGAGGSRS